MPHSSMATSVPNFTRFDNASKKWTALRAGLPQHNAYDLVCRHGLNIDSVGEHLLMGSTTGNLWTSDNGGRNWQAFSSHLSPIYAVSFA
jgi:hypothetical protein